MITPNLSRRFPSNPAQRAYHGTNGRQESANSSMLILSRADVESLLDPDELLEALATAMVDLSKGRTSMPPRIASFVAEEGGLLATMPAYVPSAGILESKLVTVFPGNAAHGLHTHQAVIVAFDPSNGAPIALMDGTHITAARTAAGSALATRLLARRDAGVLAVLGTGVQARAHARAVTRVRNFAELRIAGRDPRKAAELAEELHGVVGEVRARHSYEMAVRGADVVCATTHSPEPVIQREWLMPGTHVNSVGLNQGGPEVDRATVLEAVVVVESRAAALAPFPAGAGELLGPVAEGLLAVGQVHEIGELLDGVRVGRTNDEQVTLYKSVGVAAQDAAAAALVLAAARKRGRGHDVAL
jgi:ornithine cyclodeaminase/alanine dehydrogenase-like protein (mu-crystallin family)